MKNARTCPSGYRTIGNKCKTIVIFRKWKGKDGDVIALFPDVKADFEGNIMSYEHIGQHGAADYNHVVSKTRLATKKEFRPLLKELDDIGYKKSELEIRKKRL